METADLGVLFLEYLEAPRERVGNLQVSVVAALVVAARLAVVERGLHLSNCRDHPFCLFNHPLSLLRHLSDLVLQSIGKGGE